MGRASAGPSGCQRGAVRNQKKGERPDKAITTFIDGVDFCWHTKGWVKLPAQSIIIISRYLSCAYKAKSRLVAGFPLAVLAYFW